MFSVNGIYSYQQKRKYDDEIFLWITFLILWMVGSQHEAYNCYFGTNLSVSGVCKISSPATKFEVRWTDLLTASLYCKSAKLRGPYEELTSSHFLCCCSESQEWPSSLTPRRKNSFASCAMRPSSVVHTGVKSAGCENSTHHLQQSALLDICRTT